MRRGNKKKTEKEIKEKKQKKTGIFFSKNFGYWKMFSLHSSRCVRQHAAEQEPKYYKAKSKNVKKENANK